VPFDVLVKLPKLFFCDLDGTLLDENGALSPDSRRAFLELGERGTRVVLASGRLPGDMRQTCEALNLQGPQIAMNGALLCSPITGENLLERSLDSAAVHEHLRFAREHDVAAVLAYPDGHRTSHLGPAVRTRFKDRLPDEVPDIEALAASRPLKTYLLVGSKRYRALLSEARSIFEGRFEVTSGGQGVVVELLALDANKGHAAQTLASYLGVPMSQVAAAGDSLNDIEILRACPVSIAMYEAPAYVRAVSTHIAPPRSEGGLVAAVDQLFRIHSDSSPIKRRTYELRQQCL
jgi:Cof subfamily protein (haloacid dehalogenase superfamily)